MSQSQSESINELAAALSKAQGEMQAAIKDKKGFYKDNRYADLTDVWDAARPVLGKYGLCVMQTTELSSDGSKVILTTTLAHSSGQWIKSFIPLIPTKNDMQGMGGAITYFRRYCFSAIVGVVCEEDDDGETAVGRGKGKRDEKVSVPSKQEPIAVQMAANPEPIEYVNPEEIIALMDLIQWLDDVHHGNFLNWIKSQYNADCIEKIPRSAFMKCMNALNARVKYLKDQEKAVAV